jgi:hypothetical protein
MHMYYIIIILFCFKASIDFYLAMFIFEKLVTPQTESVHQVL